MTTTTLYLLAAVAVGAWLYLRARTAWRWAAFALVWTSLPVVGSEAAPVVLHAPAGLRLYSFTRPRAPLPAMVDMNPLEDTERELSGIRAVPVTCAGCLALGPARTCAPCVDAILDEMSFADADGGPSPWDGASGNG